MNPIMLILFLFFTMAMGKSIGSGFFDYSLNNIFDTILLPVSPCDHWTGDTAGGLFTDRVGSYPGTAGSANVNCTTAGWWSKVMKFHGTANAGVWCRNDINFVSQTKLCVAALVTINDTGNVQCFWTKGSGATNRMTLYLNYGRINFDVGNGTSGTLYNYNVGMHKFPGIEKTFPIIVSMDFTQASASNKIQILVGVYDGSDGTYSPTTSGNMPTTTTSSADSLWFGSFGASTYPMRNTNCLDEICVWKISSQLSIAQMQAIAINMMNATKIVVIGQSNNTVHQNFAPYIADSGSFYIKYTDCTIRQLTNTKSSTDSGARSPYPALSDSMHKHTGRPIIDYGGSVDSHGLFYSTDNCPWMNLGAFPWQDASQWGRVYYYDHWPLVIADWQEDASLTTFAVKQYTDSAVIFQQRWCDTMHAPGTLFGLSYFGRIGLSQRNDSTIDRIRTGVFQLDLNRPDIFRICRNGMQYSLANEKMISVKPVNGTTASAAGNWFKGVTSGETGRTNYSTLTGPLFLISNDNFSKNFQVGEIIREYTDSACTILANAQDTVTAIVQRGHYTTEREFNLCGSVHLYNFCKYLNGELSYFKFPRLVLQDMQMSTTKKVKVITGGNVGWSVAGGDYTRGWEGYTGSSWIVPSSAAKDSPCIDLNFSSAVRQVRYLYNSLAGLNYDATTSELGGDSMDNILITDINKMGAISHVYIPLTDTQNVKGTLAFGVRCSLSIDVWSANIYLQAAANDLSFSMLDSVKPKSGGDTWSFSNESCVGKTYYRIVIVKSSGENDTTINRAIQIQSHKRFHLFGNWF